MMQSFAESVVGDVLIAPFVVYAGEAFIVVMLLRPVLARIGFDRLFSHPSIALLCLYITVVAFLVVVA
jgi:Protein of unknown function (DUF1656)